MYVLVGATVIPALLQGSAEAHCGARPETSSLCALRDQAPSLSGRTSSRKAFGAQIFMMPGALLDQHRSSLEQFDGIILRRGAFST